MKKVLLKFKASHKGRGPRRLHSEGYERMVDPESYMDANIFICWLGGHPTFGGKAREWMKKVEEAQ
jgi:hypothetical protein